MLLLILGFILFIDLHLVPVFMQGARQQVIAKIGNNPYRGLFSLLILLSLYMIIKGFQTTEISIWYTPPTWAYHLAPILIFFAFLLFIATYAPTNIRRLVRHPQLAGLKLWAVAHLLVNGENRSVVLFTGFLAFGVIAMIGSNKRDGDWIKPHPKPRSLDVMTVAITLILFAGFMHFHEWLIGVSPLPMLG